MVQPSVQPEARMLWSHLSEEQVLPPCPQYYSARTQTFWLAIVVQP